MTEAVMSVLLLTAAIMDLRRGKISNRIIVFGWLVAYSMAAMDMGMLQGLLIWKRVCCVILLFWPLFLLHAIGAGDIKLWSVIAAVYSLSFLFWVMVVLFILAGIVSVAVMGYRHLFAKRLRYMVRYFCWGRACGKYYDQNRDGTGITIKLAPFTCVAYGMVLLGRWRGIC